MMFAIKECDTGKRQTRMYSVQGLPILSLGGLSVKILGLEDGKLGCDCKGSVLFVASCSLIVEKVLY